MNQYGRENANPNKKREHRNKENQSKSNNQTQRKKENRSGRPDKPTLKQFKCNVCYKKNGYFMSDCGCFFCKECFEDANSPDDMDKTCIICNKPKTRCFDLRDKHQLSKIEHDLTEPRELLAKAINAIKVSQTQLTFSTVPRHA